MNSREAFVPITNVRSSSACCLVLAAVTALALTTARARAQGVRVAPGTIGGVVNGPHGPEAGVWVIAETHDLPTKYVKIVVTDDQGRYILPDLPQANYD